MRFSTPSRVLFNLVALGSLTLLLEACGQDPDAKLNRIIGDNDLTPVSTHDLNTYHLRAIGRMDLGCTVTHVGKGIAITAGHCVSDEEFTGIRKDVACTNDDHKVSWGVTKDDQDGYLDSDCVKVLATEYNEERDYAILRIAPAPSEVMPVDLAATKPGIGSRITIYSHPQKRPMEWSGWCSISEMFPLAAGNQFGYVCDTEGGSSGASVLSEQHKVIGIHNYYNGMFNLNGATYLGSTSLATILANAR